MSKTVIATKKIKLIVEGDKEEKSRVFDVIRQGMIDQNNAMNLYMSTLYAEKMAEVSVDDRKEMSRLFTRMSDSKKGSAYSESVQFPTCFGTPSAAVRNVDQDFRTALKKGLQYGNVSLPMYRKDNPLILIKELVCLRSSHKKHTGLYHEYASDEEFRAHLYKNDLRVYLSLPMNITFRLDLGTPKNAAELRTSIGRVFDGTYEICQSSLDIEKRDLYLLLCVKVPVVDDIVLDKNVTVGVDLGCWVPAYCVLNTTESEYGEKYYESADYHIHQTRKLQHERRSLQSALQTAKGGHGRGKKMKAYDRYHEREANFKKTYNHMIAKRVVEFALRNHAQYINLEKLTGLSKGLDKKKQSEDEKERSKRLFLKSWPYYQLQTFIKNNASKYGIKVRYVKPAYSSQTCSYCGNNEDGQRISRSEFVCKNPNCKMFGKKIHADFNAARNIALDTDFLDEADNEENIVEEDMAS